MLEIIRTHRRWMLFFVLVLILPSFVFFGIQGYNQMIDSDRAVAKVAGQPILQPEVEHAQRRYFEQLKSQFGEAVQPEMMDTPQMRASVLERLMNEKALLAQVKRVQVVYSDAQLAHFYSTASDFLEAGEFSPERKTQIANGLGLTGVGLDQLLRREQSALVLRSGVSQTGILPNTVRDRILALTAEQREVRVLQFEPKAYEAQVSVADDAVNLYYEKNLKQYEIPESIDADYVVLNLDTIAEKISVQESELRQQYDTQFGADLKKRDEVRQKAQALLDEIRQAPERFEALAKEHSQDPGSAQNGGLLPAFGRGEMVKSFEQAAFALSKGALASDLVETEFGLHILKLEDIKKDEQGERRIARHILLTAPEVKSFEAIRADLEKNMRAQAAQRQFIDAAENFRNTVYEQSDSLKPVAERLGLEIQQAKGVTRAGSASNGKALPEKLVQALFTDEVLKEKNNTSSIETSPGTLYAARVVAYQPVRVRPLEEVVDQIRAQLRQEQASRLAKEAAQQRLKQLNAQSSDEGFSQPVTVGRMSPEGLPLEALKKVMAVEKNTLPAYVLAELNNGAYGIYRVLNSKNSDTPNPDQVSAITQSLARQVGAADDQAYLGALRALHGAKVLNTEYKQSDLDLLPLTGEAEGVDE